MAKQRKWRRESSPGRGNKRYKRAGFRERIRKQHPIKRKSGEKKAPEGAGDGEGEQITSGAAGWRGMSSDFYFKNTTLDFW